MAMAVRAEELLVFWATDGLECEDILRLDFINKGYSLNAYILYFMRFRREIYEFRISNIRQMLQSGCGLSFVLIGLLYDDVQSYEPTDHL